MYECMYVYLYYVHLWVEPILGHTEAFHVFLSSLLSLSITLFLFFSHCTEWHFQPDCLTLVSQLENAYQAIGLSFCYAYN